MSSLTPSTRYDELSATWKTEIQIPLPVNWPTSSKKSRGQQAYRSNRLHLYPYFDKGLLHSYEGRVRNTIAHYIRAFRFPTEFRHGDGVNFDIYDLNVLRLRIAYLYWVSIHTGAPDPNFRALFTGLHDKYGSYTLKKEAEKRRRG